MRVNEFAIGMGPAILHKTEGGDRPTPCGLLPIGGFCAMEGEEEDSGDPTALNNQSFWKKLIIFAAGAFMNFLTGLIIIVVLYAGAKAFYVPVITGLCRRLPPPERERPAGGGPYLCSIDGERDLRLQRRESAAAAATRTGVFDLMVKRDGQNA